MIIQLGALFSGLATGLGGILRQAAPLALEVGGQFLQREINRKIQRRQRQSVAAQVVIARNAPGISVARLGGTIQPVGGRVARSTFTPAALTPAQNPFGNIPLLPVKVGGGFAAFPSIQPLQPGDLNGARMPTLTRRAPGAPGEPRFAKDEMGRTVMFVPAVDGSGFITVAQARALTGTAMKPFWRFNRLESQFEKISPRRMNPFNFRAAKRAGRRIERTLDAIKNVVTIQRKMEKGVSAGGKIVKFRTKKRKKA